MNFELMGSRSPIRYLMWNAARLPATPADAPPPAKTILL
jgi:hypothetical protein